MAKRSKTSKPADQDEHQDQDVYPPMATPEGMTLMPVEALKYNVPPAFDMSEHPAELAELKAGNQGPMTALMVNFVREHLDESGCRGCARQAECRTFREAFPDQTKFATVTESDDEATLTEMLNAIGYGQPQGSEATDPMRMFSQVFAGSAGAPGILSLVQNLRRVNEHDFELDRLVEQALINDTTVINKSRVHKFIQDLDDIIDLGEKHECNDPMCRVNEFIPLRIAQRERVGHVPQFRIIKGRLVEYEGPVPTGFTRFDINELPVWVKANIAKHGVDPDQLMAVAIDVKWFGTPPADDDPVNFIVTSIYAYDNEDLPVEAGHTRFTRRDGYPAWLLAHLAKKGEDANTYGVIEAKWLGTPPADDHPSNFHVIHVLEVRSANQPSRDGYTRYQGPNYPKWLEAHINIQVSGNAGDPIDLSGYKFLDVKYIGTPPA